MTPADLCDLTWAKLQPLLTGQRLAVLMAWRQHGPGTTRQIAQRSGIDLLTFRPRTTELYTLGLLLVEGRDGTEGIYIAVAAEHARRECELALLRARHAEQTLLKLPA